MKDGEISERGTFSELVNVDGPFAEFIRTYLDQEEEEQVEEDSEDEGISITVYNYPLLYFHPARELKKELRQTISKLSYRNDDESEFYQSTHSNNYLFESKKSHRRQSSVRLSKSKSVLAEEAEEEMKKSQKKKLIEDEVMEVGGVRTTYIVLMFYNNFSD